MGFLISFGLNRNLFCMEVEKFELGKELFFLYWGWFKEVVVEGCKKEFNVFCFCGIWV